MAFWAWFENVYSCFFSRFYSQHTDTAAAESEAALYALLLVNDVIV